MKNLVKNLLMKTMLTMATIFVIGTAAGTESEAAGSKGTKTQVVNYVATNPDYKEINYTWTASDGTVWDYSYSIDKSAYEYYSSLDRYYYCSEYINYIDDAYNHAIIEQIVDGFQKLQQTYGFSDYQVLELLIDFVQGAIEYEYDIDGKGQVDYPKYPIETLFSKKGDCEDTTILLAAIIKELGYGCAVLQFEDHVAVAAKGNIVDKPHYETPRGKYYYIETTGTGWDIGEIPERYWKQSAQLNFLN